MLVVINRLSRENLTSPMAAFNWSGIPKPKRMKKGMDNITCALFFFVHCFHLWIMVP